MKKVVSIVLIMLILFTLNIQTAAEVDDSDINSFYFYDSVFDTYGLGKNIDEKAYPASITKIVTAMVALDEIDDLKQTVVASEDAISHNRVGGSEVGIVTNEVLTYETLLKALLINSANEAAYILAESIAGNQEAFINLMNKKAEELNAYDTHFENPCGLHEDNHYTTASDILLFAKEAMSYDFIKETVRETSFSMPTTNMHTEENWSIVENTNLLLTNELYKSDLFLPTGIKTGTTPYAGYCLLSSAYFPDVETEIFLVVLGASNEDSLYSYTYNKLIDIKNSFYSEQKLFDKNTVFSTINYKENKFDIVNNEDVFISLPDYYNSKKITYEIETADNITFPILEEYKAGQLNIYYDNHIIKQVDLNIKNKDTFNNILIQNSKNNEEENTEIINDNATSSQSNNESSLNNNSSETNSSFNLVKILVLIFIVFSIIFIIYMIRKEFKKINNSGQTDI